METSRESIVLWIKKIIICTISLILLGIGCGINVATSQGADPITVFYDGLSKALNVSVGATASFLNFALILLVLVFSFISAKINKAKSFKEIIKYLFKYISIGTVIYLVVLGNFIDFGICVYNFLKVPEGLPLTFIYQIGISLIGCIFCFVGLGGFMSIDIGVDPWTAFAVILAKKFNTSFRVIKIILDALTLLCGWLLGGTVGVITLFCVVCGGPIIQKSSEILDKELPKMLQSNYKNQVKKQ